VGLCNSLCIRLNNIGHFWKESVVHAAASCVPGMLSVSIGVSSAMDAIHFDMSEPVSLNVPVSAKYEHSGLRGLYLLVK
jgi:hypothetical protein